MTAPAFAAEPTVASAMTDALAASLANVPADDAPAATPEEQTVPTVDLSDAAGTEPDGTSGDEGDEPVESDAITLPDGFVSVPSVVDGLATQFILRDADGEVEIPALMVEYTANGKVRTDRLDQVVKLAQWGVYNEARDAEAKQIKQQAEMVTQERAELAELLAEREAQIAQLLTDDDFLLSVRDAYEQETSPERRATRAEQAVRDLQVEHQMAAIVETGQQFYEGEIAPALSLLAEALPRVSMQELADKFEMAMHAHVEQAPNGARYIPASRYEAVRQFILDDLAVWAQAQHIRRGPSEPPASQRETAQALAERDQARVEAQKAKRNIGTMMTTEGRSDRTIPPAKAKAPATVDDAMSSVMASVLASM